MIFTFCTSGSFNMTFNKVLFPELLEAFLSSGIPSLEVTEPYTDELRQLPQMIYAN